MYEMLKCIKREEKREEHALLLDIIIYYSFLLTLLREPEKRKGQLTKKISISDKAPDIPYSLQGKFLS